MDNFLDAYFKIDTDGSEEITVDELKQYMKENNCKESFVQKWLMLFDNNDDGVITLDEYCTTLGLVTSEARIARRMISGENSQIPEKKLPGDVEVLFSSISKEMEIDIVDLAAEAWEKFTTPSDVAKYIKEKLDEFFEPKWQVFLINGQYHLNCSTAPEGSFNYKRGRTIYLNWKTMG